MGLFDKLFGTRSQRELKKIQPTVDKVLAMEEEYRNLSEEELREHSHYPQKYYGQTHFQPKSSDDRLLLLLNQLRTQIRRTEISCCHAFSDRDGKITRPDLVQTLNRLSAACYILMIRRKAEKEGLWSSSSNK